MEDSPTSDSKLDTAKSDVSSDLIKEPRTNSTSIENNVSWREKYRVRIGFFFGILFLWRAQPRSLIFICIGFTISLLGILLRQWAAGCVRKMDTLATTGPYAIVRHPLYVGSFLAAIGLIIAASSINLSIAKPYLDRTLLFWAFFWILLDSIYLPKVIQEEKNVEEKFGESFKIWAQKVPRFLPHSIQITSFDFSTFDWKVWKKNEEYWSFLGYLLLCLFLVGRYISNR